MNDIVILSAARTALGVFEGSLASQSASQLGTVAIKSAIIKAGVGPANVSDAILGNVLQAGGGQAPARQAAIHAGLLPATHCATVHKVCGSSLEAIILGSRILALGDGECIVAGGMESMSQAPYLLPKAREGYRLGHHKVIDSIIHDGLWDPYSNLHMGACAEDCVKKYGFTREEQDAYAVESFRRASAAQQNGDFASEISPVELVDGKGEPTLVDRDEGPTRIKYEKIPKLRPAFRADGTITPANASSLNDGAAVLVLSTAKFADANGLKPIARLISFGTHSHEPAWFTTAPVVAAQNALKKAGWDKASVDLWEINEAFAVVPMAFMKELNLSHDNTNVNGGAIALGHPIGASGARILVTLLAALRKRAAKRGLAAICIGGGEGLAACVEMI
jgi:acetyl-CoA C-acetyltransferase